MSTYMTGDEVASFWERHRTSRESLDQSLAALPFEEKLEIMERLQADVEVLQESERDNHLFFQNIRDAYHAIKGDQ